MYYIERYLVAGSREKRKEKERTVRHKIFDRFATAGLFISFQHAVRIMKNSNKRKKKEKENTLLGLRVLMGQVARGPCLLLCLLDYYPLPPFQMFSYWLFILLPVIYWRIKIAGMIAWPSANAENENERILLVYRASPKEHPTVCYCVIS